MVPKSPVPAEISHRRLIGALSQLADDDAHRPSLLPGWTVGHVLTHLARNAESHVRMLDAAARGEVADQYPGGNAQRAADIAAGAGRPAADLVADVMATVHALEAAWRSTPAEVWSAGVGRMGGGLVPVAELPFLRWREVEIHHVDLGLGYGVADWPDAYVEAELARSLASLPARLAPGAAVTLHATDTGETWTVPEGATDARPVTGDRRLLLAWVVGRAEDPGLPSLKPWPG